MMLLYHILKRNHYFSPNIMHETYVSAESVGMYARGAMPIWPVGGGIACNCIENG